MSRRPQPLYVAVFLLALVLRVSAWIGTGEARAPNIHASEHGYIAEDVARGAGYRFKLYDHERYLASFFPPLFALTFSAPLSFGLPGVRAWQVVQITLSSLVCVAVAWIGTALLGARVGVLAGVLTAGNPPQIVKAYAVEPTALDTVCLVGLATALVRFQQTGSRVSVAVAGLAIGLGGLSRPVLLVLLPLVAGLIAWKMRGFPSAAVRIALLLAIAGTVLAPWTIRNYRIHGTPVLVSTNGGFNLWIGNNPFSTGSQWSIYLDRYEAYSGRRITNVIPSSSDANIGFMEGLYPPPLRLEGRLDRTPETEVDRLYFEEAARFIVTHPGDVAILLVKKFLAYWLTPVPLPWANTLDFKGRPLYAVIYAPLLALFVVGVRSSGVAVPHGILLALLVFFSLAYSVFFVNIRFRLPAEPIMWIYAAHGLATLWQARSTSGALRGQTP